MQGIDNEEYFDISISKTALKKWFTGFLEVITFFYAFFGGMFLIMVLEDKGVTMWFITPLAIGWSLTVTHLLYRVTPRDNP